MNYIRNFRFLFGVFLIITSIFTVVTIPFIGVPVLGGVILQGILGGFSGKVGPVVGATWKGIDYMRGYVIPANPNTSGQQTVRTKWSVLSKIASSLVSTLLTTYWDPFASAMSGYNRFMQVNYSSLDGSNDLTITSLMADGTLETLKTNATVYTSGSGAVVITYDDTIVGNGLTTDSVLGIVYDKTNNNFYFSDGSDTRGSGATNLTLPTGLTATNLIGYVFAFRGTGETFIVSDSIADVASA